MKRKKIYALYTVNTLLSLLYLSPLIWMIVSAFKPENRIFADMAKGLTAFIPAQPTLENFKEVFFRSDMLHYICLLYTSNSFLLPTEARSRAARAKVVWKISSLCPSLACQHMVSRVL